MQVALFSIWTRFAMFSSYNDNHLTTNASGFFWGVQGVLFIYFTSRGHLFSLSHSLFLFLFLSFSVFLSFFLSLFLSLSLSLSLSLPFKTLKKTISYLYSSRNCGKGS